MCRPMCRPSEIEAISFDLLALYFLVSLALSFSEQKATKSTMLSRSRSLLSFSLLVPSRIHFEWKAVEEGGRSEMKGKTKWRGGWSRSREWRKYSVFFLGRFLNSWKSSLPILHPTPRDMFFVVFVFVNLSVYSTYFYRSRQFGYLVGIEPQNSRDQPSVKSEQLPQAGA
jgi:hypothetical protein